MGLLKGTGVFPWAVTRILISLKAPGACAHPKPDHIARRAKYHSPTHGSAGVATQALAATPTWMVCTVAITLCLATLLAYRGTAHFPFHFDAACSITENPTFRKLWPPWVALVPPGQGGLTVVGRPMLNLSLALASTWILLGFLIAGAQGRGGTVGFATPITPWDYLTTHAWAIIHYLGLTVWPAPLVLDYGYLVITNPTVWVPCGLGVLVLLAATVLALVRLPALGFLGTWFFAILAPTSSLIPVVTQPVTEHRMYLPLAALAMLAAVGAAAPAGRGGRAVWAGDPPDADSASPRLNLANTHLDSGRPAEALPLLDEAVRMDPGLAEAHVARGNALLQLGRLPEAAVAYERAVELQPGLGQAQFALGNALVDLGRLPEAIAHLQEAVRLSPRSVPALNNLADALMRAGRTAEAITVFEQALALEPGNPYLRANLSRLKGGP